MLGKNLKLKLSVHTLKRTGAWI